MESARAAPAPLRVVASSVLHAEILEFVTGKLGPDPRVLRLASLLTSAEVAAFIRTRYRGSVIPVRPT